jgi:hypothetical protein
MGRLSPGPQVAEPSTIALTLSNAHRRSRRRAPSWRVVKPLPSRPGQVRQPPRQLEAKLTGAGGGMQRMAAPLASAPTLRSPPGGCSSSRGLVSPCCLDAHTPLFPWHRRPARCFTGRHRPPLPPAGSPAGCWGAQGAPGASGLAPLSALSVSGMSAVPWWARVWYPGALEAVAGSQEPRQHLHHETHPSLPDVLPAASQGTGERWRVQSAVTVQCPWLEMVLRGHVVPPCTAAAS